MKWFKKPAVCSECGLHFEPAHGSHGSDLCSTHRKPLLELERRKAFVLAWAAQHWQELEEQAQRAAQPTCYGNSSNLAALQAAANAYGNNQAAQGGGLQGRYAGPFGL